MSENCDIIAAFPIYDKFGGIRKLILLYKSRIPDA